MSRPYPAGLFDRRSAIRRINQESVLLLGGGRALLMQIAHPQVAAGVAAHSAFRRDRLGRLTRTLRPMYAIVFGTPEQAQQAAAAVRRRHSTVVGEGYRAGDPDLLLWVHGTLVDTALTVYSRFVRPLTPQEEAAYYRDSMLMGELLGVPRAVMPPDIAAFREYVDRTTASLEVGDAAQAIAAEIFAPRPLVAAPLFLGLRAVTSGLLPPPLREPFGLGWGARREALFRVVARVSRAVWPRLPARLRRPAPLMPPETTPR